MHAGWDSAEAASPREKRAHARLRAVVLPTMLERERRVAYGHAIVLVTVVAALFAVTQPMLLFTALLMRIASFAATRLAIHHVHTALKSEAPVRSSLGYLYAAQALAGITWAGLIVALDPARDPPVIWALCGGVVMMGSGLVLITFAPIRKAMLAMALGFVATLFLSTWLDPTPLAVSYVLAAMPVALGAIAFGVGVARQTYHEAQLMIDNTALNSRLASSLERAQYLAERDSMTGIYSRRTLFTRFREPVPLGDVRSLIMVKIDRLRDVNTRFGQHVGDGVLRALAREMEYVCGQVPRAQSCCVRLSGEEFAIMLDQIDIREAMAIAKHLNERIPHIPCEFEHERGLKLSASISVTEQAPRESLQTLLQHAEQGIGRAKALGGNMIAPPLLY